MYHPYVYHFIKIFVCLELSQLASYDGIFFVFNGTELMEVSRTFMMATERAAKYKTTCYKHSYHLGRVLALV